VKKDWAAVGTASLVTSQTPFHQEAHGDTEWQQCSSVKGLLGLALVSHKQLSVDLARSSSRPMDKSVPMGQCVSYATLSGWVQMWFP